MTGFTNRLVKRKILRKSLGKVNDTKNRKNQNKKLIGKDLLDYVNNNKNECNNNGDELCKGSGYTIYNDEGIEACDFISFQNELNKARSITKSQRLINLDLSKEKNIAEGKIIRQAKKDEYAYVQEGESIYSFNNKEFIMDPNHFAYIVLSNEVVEKFFNLNQKVALGIIAIEEETEEKKIKQSSFMLKLQQLNQIPNLTSLMEPEELLPFYGIPPQLLDFIDPYTSWCNS